MARKPLPPFVETCVSRLSPLGPIRVRAMFGGYGLYCEDDFFAIIAFDRLYFKADAQNKADFERAGAEPFRYEGKEKPVIMSYYTLPDAIDADPAEFLHFAELGMAAAKRKKKKN